MLLYYNLIQGGKFKKPSSTYSVSDLSNKFLKMYLFCMVFFVQIIISNIFADTAL